MEKETKITQWFKENKGEIKKRSVNFAKGCGLILVGGLIGSHYMAKSKDEAHAEILTKLYINGYMKYFDPSTNQEVNYAKIIDVIKRDISKRD